MWRDERVDNGGVGIAVRDWGGAGRPVVLVHGGPGQNLGAWVEFAPLLLPELRPIALDVRGNGASDDADDYGWRALVSDIDAVARWADIGRPIVIGHSWGGQLATYYASQYATCAGAIGVDGWITDVRTRFGDATWRWIEEGYRASAVLTFTGTTEELRAMLDGVATEDGVAAAAVAGRDFVTGADGAVRPRRSVADVVRIQRSVDEGSKRLSTELYGAMACPVLLVGGERSEAEVQAMRDGRLGAWAFSKAATMPIVERYAHVEVEWWGCGHDVAGEMGAELAGRCKAFVGSVAR